MKNFTQMKFKIIEDSTVSELDQEAILLNLSSGIYFQLNSIGLFIVSNLDRLTDFNEVKYKILNEYNVSERECEDDLSNFLTKLDERGLLEVLKK
tara:strand:+ start:700 stop:984 length:285 start_codon:yes stop_codon:yes gene_type:complete